jgi:Mlo family
LFPFLQTPTYILALVLVFFLILTLGFEHCIHALKRLLRNRGREGLAQVVDKAVLELTLLGFVSLILILFQDNIPDICIPYSIAQADWTLLQNLDDCPCCLSTTYGITTCAMMSHDCGFNTTTKEPYCGCSLGWSESTYDPLVIPNASDYCTAYENKEDQFIFEQALGSLITEISPVEFCNSVANGSLTFTPSAEDGGGGPGDAGRRRRSLLGGGSTTSDNVNELNGLHVVPEVTTFRCEGPFYAGTCDSGRHPAISYTALHQIHLLIFTIAAMHVLVSVLVVIIAGFRIRQWRQWQKQDIVNGPKHLISDSRPGSGGSNGIESHGGELDKMNNSISTTKDMSVGAAGRRYDTLLSNLEENLPPPQEESTLETNNTMQNSVGAAATATMAGVTTADNTEGTEDTPTATAPEDAAATSALFVSEVHDAAKTVHRHWMRRDSRLLKKRHRLAESAICLGQALLPNLVSQYEFSTMRVGYIGSHNLPETYDWVEQLMHHLDFDLVHIIGASLVTWGIFIFEWLFSGLAGWISSLFILLGALCVFAINIWLVAAIRFGCRGGRPHRIRRVSRWYNNPGWLSLPIGGIVFLCSTSFSTALFFLWQFGADSCFFSNQDQELWRWLPGNLPWYTGLISPGVLLIWMAYVTIPAWALVVHMRPKAICIDPSKKGEAEVRGVADVEKPPPPRQELQQQGSSRELRTQAVVMAEMKKLQDELMELQAPS